MDKCATHGTGGRSGECEGCKAYWRTKRAAYRQRNPDYWRSGAASEGAGNRSLQRMKARLLQNARARGRQAGIEATIKADEIDWPSHCPVLGTELDYRTTDRTGIPHANLPSIDRWDNDKGYVPGNVAVISLRANEIKRDASIAEMRAILNYMQSTPF